MKLNINDTFNVELPPDPVIENNRRQVENACFSFVTPKIPTDPKLIHVSSTIASELGLNATDTQSPEFLAFCSGSTVYEGSHPYSMCYGGHQFGHWAGQLGDGRAINLMEITQQDKRWALQLKGAGETPYSRTADGLAVLRSSIREHLCSEAMYHLGVPTTRSLSLCLSGDKVLRDVMYDGNAAYEKGAIVCRVAPSFVRFGNFQIFASRGDKVRLQLLVDYTVKYFFPEIHSQGHQKVIDFFNAVLDKTLSMIIHWQRVGFVHGVMNTDNMSILGLTIDYGPYGWLEGYQKDWTPNTTDRQHKRYKFGNQPSIALWNLYQLANALILLTENPAPFEDSLKRYKEEIGAVYVNMMRSKLGLAIEEKEDELITQQLESLLELVETDMTIFFRSLASISKTDTPQNCLDKIKKAFYPESIPAETKAKWLEWFAQYIKRLENEILSDVEKAANMNAVNPKFVLRNYMAQMAIDRAEVGDYSVVEELYELLKFPYAEQAEHNKWFAKRPEWARHKVGCSMLSCSS